MQSEVKKVRLARLERFLPHELLVTHAPKYPLAKAIPPFGNNRGHRDFKIVINICTKQEICLYLQKLTL